MLSLATLVVLGAWHTGPALSARADNLISCGGAVVLPNIGLHAKDDLAHTDACKSVAECCAFCAATTTCTAWTLDGTVCRAKGPAAAAGSCTVESGCRVACSGCFSGFMGPAPSPPPAPPAPKGARNVLFIVVDDLRPQMGPYGQNQTVTPNLDALASGALVFDNAYCQQAVCSPSRNSFLSGRRPDATKTWNFKTNFRDPGVGAHWDSMPQYFKKHGYMTAGTGKVYHPGEPPDNDPASWTEPYNPQGQISAGCPACPGRADWCGNAWCSLDRNSTVYNYTNNDEWIATDGARLLTFAAADPRGRPFFVAVGLHKPHTPYAYPSEIDSLYPPATQIRLPTATARVVPVGSPQVAWNRCSAIAGFNESSPMSDVLAQQHRRAYYAAVTHTDQLIGTLLAKLRALVLEATTAVVVVGDHGYELGEHDMWCKKNNWELGVRVPFIVKVPWMPGSMGRHTAALAELVDLYPTLAELAGLPPPTEIAPGTGGASLVPVLEDPAANHSGLKSYAFSQYPRCGPGALLTANGDCNNVPAAKFSTMGYSVRDAAFRYTEWKRWDGTALAPAWDDTVAAELYDHTGDRGRDFNAFGNVNVVSEAGLAPVVARLRDALQAQFHAPSIFA